MLFELLGKLRDKKKHIFTAQRGFGCSLHQFFYSLLRFSFDFVSHLGLRQKCKNDPIWQTYNRAYKAHYVRYMKKKMTVAEIEEWSRFASDIRDRALAGKIKFEQYYMDIRK